MTVSPIPSLGPTRADVERVFSEDIVAQAERLSIFPRPLKDSFGMWSDKVRCAALLALFPVEAGDVGWRLLARDEMIWRGDQVLKDDCVSWGDLVGWEIGLPYNPGMMVPVRRSLAASPPLAEGEGSFSPQSEGEKIPTEQTDGPASCMYEGGPVDPLAAGCLVPGCTSEIGVACRKPGAVK